MSRQVEHPNLSAATGRPYARLPTAHEPLVGRRTRRSPLVRLAAFVARAVDAQACTITLERGEASGKGNRHSWPASSKAGMRSASSRAEANRSAVATGRGGLPEPSGLNQASGVNGGARKCTRAIRAPITVGGKALGSIEVFVSNSRPEFDARDLDRLEMAALFVGKSIQVIQLQDVLRSRLAQLALAQSQRPLAIGSATSILGQGQMAKILARTFYREMANSGFDYKQIIDAATGIISELTRSLAQPQAATQ